MSTYIWLICVVKMYVNIPCMDDMGPEQDSNATGDQRILETCEIRQF